MTSQIQRIMGKFWLVMLLLSRKDILLKTCRNLFDLNKNESTFWIGAHILFFRGLMKILHHEGHADHPVYSGFSVIARHAKTLQLFTKLNHQKCNFILEWARRNEGGSSTSVVAASADSMRGGARRSDQMVGNTGNASSTRVYESSQRMSHHEAQPPRAGDFLFCFFFSFFFFGRRGFFSVLNG